MRKTIKNIYAAQWQPIFDLWVPFCREANQLGISSSRKALSNFLGVHRAKLLELGVIAKTNKQRILGRRELFAPAAFALLIHHDPVSAIEQHRRSMAQSDGAPHDHAD